MNFFNAINVKILRRNLSQADIEDQGVVILSNCCSDLSRLNYTLKTSFGNGPFKPDIFHYIKAGMAGGGEGGGEQIPWSFVTDTERLHVY